MMPRVLPSVCRAVLALCCTLHVAAAQDRSAAAPRPVQGQRGWNDAVSREIVARATTRRAQQLADSGLVDYSASAHGYLTFLAQVGDGFPLSPRIVKADELALEVYWRAPNYSKQWIVGRRDTLLLPTDINYHRDHLGIVQNNFPDIIRLGDGDEVHDVAHPLSPSGLETYDYLLSDSLRFEIPGRTIDVYEVKIRPRDDRAAAAVGALYIAKDDAQVVRMAFSFTRSALRDRQLEDVSIVLENSLIEGRFWLPRRQEIEIRRTGSWMDFPARGIIRGRWEIRDYRVNQGETAALTPGPEIVYAPAERRARHRWSDEPILAALPDDVRLATDDEVRQVQEEARRLVRAQALQRSRSTLPSARSLSDLARVTRAEGLALGAGVRQRLGNGVDASLTARYGLADHEAKGTATLGWERADGLAVRLRVFRDYRDAGDVAETSRLRNTIAAQEFGSDYTQPFDTRGAALALSTGDLAGLRWRVEGGYERHDRVEVTARPSRGRYAPTIDAYRGERVHGALGVDRGAAPWRWGSELRLAGELRVGAYSARDPSDAAPSAANVLPAAPGRFVRGFVIAELERPFGHQRLVAALGGGAVDARRGVPAQELLYAGGPRSAPGYEFHEFRGRALSTQHLEWRVPVPFVPIRLGRWGQIPGEATLAPFVHGVWLHGADPSGRRGDGWYPSVGVGALSLFGLVRIDVARGVRDGRWTFALDLSRDFWSIM